jgi:hypothetical protein
MELGHSYSLLAAAAGGKKEERKERERERERESRKKSQEAELSSSFACLGQLVLSACMAEGKRPPVSSARPANFCLHYATHMFWAVNKSKSLPTAEEEKAHVTWRRRR